MEWLHEKEEARSLSTLQLNTLHFIALSSSLSIVFNMYLHITLEYEHVADLTSTMAIYVLLRGRELENDIGKLFL